MDIIFISFGAITLIGGLIIYPFTESERILKMALGFLVMGGCLTVTNSLLGEDASGIFANPDKKVIYISVLAYGGLWAVGIGSMLWVIVKKGRHRRNLKMAADIKRQLRGRLNLDKILVGKLNEIGAIKSPSK